MNDCLFAQGYAWEITTSEGGWGLHEVLQSRQDKLNGIVNGIDMSEWDPANDADTEAAYSIDDLSGNLPLLLLLLLLWLLLLFSYSCYHYHLDLGTR